jgi:predicted nucleic acid-binding protein
VLVLDANIVIRAVLGKRVPQLLHRYAGRIDFLAPDSALQEAAQHLPKILQRRGISTDLVVETLDSLKNILQVVERETYAPMENVARQRLSGRDEDDWPVLAVALLLDCPIWTEDLDFFRSGMATWTTDRVEIYLAEAVLQAGE